MPPEASTNGPRTNLSGVPFSYSICVIDTGWQERLRLPACLPACLQQLLFWNRFQHAANEVTDSRLCHNSYAIKMNL